jgi:2,3-bisphosphoglycerate-dependent phosphoglycerate mutase
MAHLILVRHGKSEWNDLGLWTGWSDVDLHPEGEIDAKNMAKLIEDLELHLMHTSTLKRAQRTGQIILEALGKTEIPVVAHEALNERSYGIHTGKNKWQVKEEVGDEEFTRIRRSWDYQVQDGESLKDVYARVVPYFEKEILPQLKTGQNVLVAAHGNSLRALTKHLCNLSEEEVCNLEIGLGEVHIYEFNEQGKIVNQEIRGENADKGKV